MRFPFQGNAKVRTAIQVNEEFLTFFYCEYFPLGQRKSSRTGIRNFINMA